MTEPFIAERMRTRRSRTASSIPTSERRGGRSSTFGATPVSHRAPSSKTWRITVVVGDLKKEFKVMVVMNVDKWVKVVMARVEGI